MLINEFDKGKDRRRLPSFKWHNVPPDGISMWLADMDFDFPLPIKAKIEEVLEQGFLGYPHIPENYFEVLAAWFCGRQHFRPGTFSILPVTGIMPALSAIIHHFTQPGDGIIVQTPVYYRIRESIN